MPHCTHALSSPALVQASNRVQYVSSIISAKIAPAKGGARFHPRSRQVTDAVVLLAGDGRNDIRQGASPSRLEPKAVSARTAPSYQRAQATRVRANQRLAKSNKHPRIRAGVLTYAVEACQHSARQGTGMPSKSGRSGLLAHLAKVGLLDDRNLRCSRSSRCKFPLCQPLL